MRDPENVLNSLQEHSAQSGYVYDRLYRNLFNREFFLRAYQNIYASQGNMTAGTDGKTIDAMSLERIDRLIATLKDESYQPKPSRRTYIPKKNGKLRPLGIPSIQLFCAIADDAVMTQVGGMLGFLGTMAKPVMLLLYLSSLSAIIKGADNMTHKLLGFV